ncbi:MAG: flagellar basal body rod protein FlgC [Clostridiales bacterium]|jgi:flagellar basal-body rod protein FlgC|nr:flagellar basal body rod protein FlgC [Clostridiales bacterium]
MAFMNSLNIIGSALTAERFRTDIISQNLANQNTTRTANGEPYRRKQVIFQEREMNFSNSLEKAIGGGVRVVEVVESQEDFVPVYDPDHPDADEDGYVLYPNVNNAEEQIDLMAASRVYESQIAALSVVKAMASKALEIGK